MTTIGQDLRTFITASTSINDVISGRMHQNKIDQSSTQDRIWYMRTNEDEALTLDGTGGLKNTDFDVECISDDAGTAITLAEKVKERTHGYNGTVGNQSAQGIFVTDKDDDYIPRTNESDDGNHVAALTVSIWHTT